jgi:hypothetical protein
VRGKSETVREKRAGRQPESGRKLRNGLIDSMKEEGNCETGKTAMKEKYRI